MAFLFFAASPGAAESATAVVAAAATVPAAGAADAAEAAFQYLQGARIRTQDSATADRTIQTELFSDQHQ